ncbi:cytochrome P450 [Streptomyces ureilyticus]|uniref:Cytochrome P450 n=1 Tax=Streptomyces ureilyticus TaxID=1775131 RepID=A0ABX0DR61_9ACTN|nr:cytochrome P450 [Streptomyces ureilyticus]NGO43229.1 cytochrome P450 [Streptomyces ureilyticus]
MNAPAQLPFEQTHLLQVAPLLRTLQSQGTVHRVRTPEGDEAWLVTGHAQVQQLLDDDRLSRSNPEPGAARDSGSALLDSLLGSFANDHARLRSLLEPHFSPKLMLALRSHVETLTEQLLDEMAGQTPPVDLRLALALPLPILVMCEWLGVPHQDKDQFGAWTQDAANVQDRVRSKQGMAELFGYCQQLIADKRQNPGDDVISRIGATEGINDQEVVGLTALLLFGGYETTVARIGTGALLLLANPEQRQALLDDPSLIPSGVEEILRMSMPNPHNGGMPRYALTDLEIDGTTIRAGDLVLLNIIAANHDQTVFTDPERVDVTRQTAGSLTFGHGTHYCVGAPLARMQLQVAIARLVARFPTMRLAVDVKELKLRHDTLLGGLVELPVTW